MREYLYKAKGLDDIDEINNKMKGLLIAIILLVVGCNLILANHLDKLNIKIQKLIEEFQKIERKVKIIFYIILALIAYLIQIVCFYARPYKKYHKKKRKSYTVGGLINHANDTIGEAYSFYALFPIVGPLLLLFTIIFYFVSIGIGSIIEFFKNIKI